MDSKPTLPDYLLPLEIYNGTFPRQAMESAIARREESLPCLLQGIEWVAQAETVERNYMLHVFALHLLAQFRETRAFENAIRIARRKDIDALLGDTITTRLHSILASLYAGDPDPIKALVENTEADEFARGAALETFATLVVEGILERETVSKYFGELFRGRLEREYSHIWDALIGTCADLGMKEHLEEIRIAFGNGLADPGYEPFKGVEKRIRHAPRPVDLQRRYRLINDAIAEMEWWAAFDGTAKVAPGPVHSAEPDEEVPRAAFVREMVRPIVRKKVEKIGRNDPCPCGSGRKYKKCCMPKDEALAREAAAGKQVGARPEPVVESPVARREPNEAVADREEQEASSAAESEKVNELWEEFGAIRLPTTGQMNAFVDNILALPPEETDWGYLFHELASKNHPDLAGLFRRVADAVPHTQETAMASFYWAAATEFDRRGLHDLLPEVAVHFRKLDSESCDADALSHIEDYLLAAGRDAEALQLSEHFLPILREQTAEGTVMPYTVPKTCARIFELRAGAALRSESAAHRPTAELAGALRRGIEDEINADSASMTAEVIAGQTQALWTRDQFDLVDGDIFEDEGAWRDALRLNAALISVAREAWQIDQVPPGSALAGLQMMLVAVYNSRGKTSKRKKARPNLLSFLAPSGIEKRVATECPDLIGINVPRARVMLDAHDILRRFALRHGLISEDESRNSESEIARLLGLIEE